MDVYICSLLCQTGVERGVGLSEEDGTAGSGRELSVMVVDTSTAAV